MKNQVLLAMSLVLASSVAFSQSDPVKAIPTIPESQIEAMSVATPMEFMSTAAASNDFEITAGKLAVEKAQSEDVRMLAQHLVDDHSKAKPELLAAGKADGIEMAEPSPDGEQEGMLGKLETAAAADFDKLYIETQIFAHQRAISLFKGYQKGGTNLSRFAEKTLPALGEHYARLVELAGQLKVGKAVQ